MCSPHVRCDPGWASESVCFRWMTAHPSVALRLRCRRCSACCCAFRFRARIFQGIEPAVPARYFNTVLRVSMVAFCAKCRACPWAGQVQKYARTAAPGIIASSSEVHASFRLPYHDQAHRADLQSRLQILLLSGKRKLYPRMARRGSVPMSPETLENTSANTSSQQDMPEVQFCLAGRRADAAGGRFLRKSRRACRASMPTGKRIHQRPANQRHAAR